MKQRTGWIIRDTENGFLFYETCSILRSEAIRKFFVGNKTWEQDYRQGYRCVRVEIREIGKVKE